jgi:hypothetical protein
LKRRSFISVLVTAVASLAFLKAETVAKILAPEDSASIAFSLGLGPVQGVANVYVNGALQVEGEDYLINRKSGVFMFPARLSDKDLVFVGMPNLDLNSFGHIVPRKGIFR